MFTMDEKFNGQTWVGNMYQRFETVFQEVDDFVNKETVKYVENHMHTVGESVKKFYSDVVQEILPPLVDPLKQIDLVGIGTSSILGIKENTINSNTDKSEEGPLVPAVECQKPLITGLCHSEQISALSGCPVGEANADVDSNKSEEGPLDLVVECQKPLITGLCQSEQISAFGGCPEANADVDSNKSEEGLLVLAVECQEPLITGLCHSEQMSAFGGCAGEANADVDSNKSEEGPLVLAVECQKPLITGLCHLEQMSAFGGCPEANADVDSNKSEDGPLVLAVECQKQLITGLCHSENISAFGGCPVREANADVNFQKDGDKLINKTSGKVFQVLSNSDTHFQEPCKDVNSATHENISSGCIDENDNDDPLAKISHEYSENHLDNRPLEEVGIFYNIKSESDDSSVYEDADSSVENIVDMNSGIDKKIEGHSSLFQSEDLNGSVHRIWFAAPFVENKLENVSMGTLDNNSNDTTGLAFSSYALSDGTAETGEAVSGTVLCRSEDDPCFKLAQSETSVPCSEIGGEDGSMLGIEHLMDTIDLSDKKQLAESCVIVEGEGFHAFSFRSGRSKSYKKIIQDALTSRKRIAKEYKQLAIWYGDIDAEFGQLTETENTSKAPIQDSNDSEWELV